MGRLLGAERGRWHCLPGVAEESSPPFLEGLAWPLGPPDSRPCLDAALPGRPRGTCLKQMNQRGKKIPTWGLLFAIGNTAKWFVI